jgi:hypothetical protein
MLTAAYIMRGQLHFLSSAWKRHKHEQPNGVCRGLRFGVPPTARKPQASRDMVASVRVCVVSVTRCDNRAWTPISDCESFADTGTLLCLAASQGLTGENLLGPTSEYFRDF